MSSKHQKIIYPSGCKEINEDLNNEELTKRLKILARCFQEMNQDENSIYKELSLFLASDFLIEHSSKEIRLLVACCITDVFRIFAPEAPYSDPDQLKNIFLFLTEQLKGLQDIDAPSFKRSFYLLENLNSVKSYNICLELTDNQDIFLLLFKTIFGVVSDKHSEKTITRMLDLLCPIINLFDTLSSDLMEVILLSIIEPYKTKNKAAYNLGYNLIKSTAPSFELLLQSFFHGIFILGKPLENVLLDKIFDIIFELNNVCPQVLHSILPLLEIKLKSNVDSERFGVTKLLSILFSQSNSTLSHDFPNLWSHYIGRFNDIDVNIRKHVTQSSKDFILHLSSYKENKCYTDIVESLKQRQHDSDESVRMDVVLTIVNAAKQNLNSVSEELLECVKERTLDKRFNIRREALNGLGQIYRQCFDSGKDLEKLSWIRNKIMYAYYHTAIEDKILVERILNVSLVPFTLDPQIKAKRLFIFYKNLDENALKAFQEIFRMQSLMRNNVRIIVETAQKCESENLQIVKSKISQLSRFMPDSTRSFEPLCKFFSMIQEDQYLRNILLKILSPDCPCKKAIDYAKDISIKMGSNKSNIYICVKQLMERIASVLIDTSVVFSITKLIEEFMQKNDSNDNLADIKTGMGLLLLLSQWFIGSFQIENIYKYFIFLFKYDDDFVVDCSMQILNNVGQGLENFYPEIHSFLIPVLTKMAMNGTPKQAKHSIQCIYTISNDKDKIFKTLFEHFSNNMNFESPNFLTNLVAIGHLVQICPNLFDCQTSEIISKFVTKELLMQDRTNCKKSSKDWYDIQYVSDETQAKMYGLKMIVRWLIGTRNIIGNRANPSLRLLYSMILCEGDLMERGLINKPEMARLRLQAGCCMLKLAQEPIYADAIRLEQFGTLALLVNDPCLEVRQIFVNKLHKGLLSLKLPLQYMAALCLGALDPIKERRILLKKMLQDNIIKRREYLKNYPSIISSIKRYSILPEYVVPFVIHLLAHDPEFISFNNLDALRSIKDCLVFLFDSLANKSDEVNFNFYSKMFEMIKQTKDAQCPNDEDANKKLYSICDLAMYLLLPKMCNLSDNDSFVDAMLPSKLFTQPDMSRSNTTIYLPQELLDSIQSKNKKVNMSKVNDVKKEIDSSQSSESRPSSPEVPKLLNIQEKTELNDLIKAKLDSSEKVEQSNECSSSRKLCFLSKVDSFSSLESSNIESSNKLYNANQVEESSKICTVTEKVSRITRKKAASVVTTNILPPSKKLKIDQLPEKKEEDFDMIIKPSSLVNEKNFEKNTIKRSRGSKSNKRNNKSESSSIQPQMYITASESDQSLNVSASSRVPRITRSQDNSGSDISLVFKSGRSLRKINIPKRKSIPKRNKIPSIRNAIKTSDNKKIYHSVSNASNKEKK